MINKLIRNSLLLMAAVALNASLAHATLIPTGLSVTAGTEFWNFSFEGTGGFSLISGGATSSSTYDGTPTVTGADPLNGSLTDTDDGTGFDGSARVTGVGDEFAIGFDSTLTTTNTHVTESYDIVFKLVFSNSVNADGDDAYALSVLTLDADLAEIFYSDLLSDTLFGDEDGGIATGGYGDLLTGGGSPTYAYTLNPGEALTLDLFWTMVGGNFVDIGLAEASLSAFLSIDSVVTRGGPPPTVPVPGTLLLMGLGMILLRLTGCLK